MPYSDQPKSKLTVCEDEFLAWLKQNPKQDKTDWPAWRAGWMASIKNLQVLFKRVSTTKKKKTTH